MASAKPLETPVTVRDADPAPAEEREKLLERILATRHYSGSALIEVLHSAQQLYGYLSKPLLKTIAHKLRLPPSKVLGVATFYHLFRLNPPKAHSAMVCLGTACYVAGATDLMDAVQRRCSGKAWTVEAGRCVGSCGLAPVVICDEETLSRATPAQVEARIGGPADA